MRIRTLPGVQNQRVQNQRGARKGALVPSNDMCHAWCTHSQFACGAASSLLTSTIHRRVWSTKGAKATVRVVILMWIPRCFRRLAPPLTSLEQGTETKGANQGARELVVQRLKMLKSATKSDPIANAVFL